MDGVQVKVFNIEDDGENDTGFVSTSNIVVTVVAGVVGGTASRVWVCAEHTAWRSVQYGRGITWG